MVRSQSSTAVSTNAPSGAIPALATITSRESRTSTCLSTIASTWSGSLTSPRNSTVRRPRPRMASTRVRTSFFIAGTSFTPTSSPSAANRSAIARPIPRAAPVTSAVRTSVGGRSRSVMGAVCSERPQLLPSPSTSDPPRSTDMSRSIEPKEHVVNVVSVFLSRKGSLEQVRSDEGRSLLPNGSVVRFRPGLSEPVVHDKRPPDVASLAVKGYEC
jgi:hypothetical protein